MNRDRRGDLPVRGRTRRWMALASLLSSAGAIAQPAPPTGRWTTAALKGEDLYATLKTNQGDVVIKLLPKQAPKTVANFVGLATGERSWTDPNTGAQTKRPLYPKTIFHRVIRGFMVQGGDPLGNGTGTPGYQFEDEPQSCVFSREGLLAMANAGPNTNGSQFFITVSTPRHLDHRHTIFGEVLAGYEVVKKISEVPTDDRDRPTQDVVLEKVLISAKPPKAAAGFASKESAICPKG